MIPIGEAGPCRTKKGQITALLLLTAAFLASFWLSGYSGGGPFPQWDKLVHTIAGAALALLFFPHIPRSRLVPFVLLVGFVFEIAEFLTGEVSYYGGWRPYLLDTALDLIVDSLGAWIVVRTYRKHD